ncbi:MAG: low molecular weight phosphatase family protein [Pseudomonadota bacterium]
MADLPGSVLFCCDHNAVRSPMAEGAMKKLHGNKVFVQSCGVFSEMEVDGFMVSVAEEKGVDIRKHRGKSFDEMEAWGDDIEAFDLVIALSPAAQRRALEFTRYASLEVEYWPTLDPTALGETRDQRLSAYRQTRDQILERIKQRFG